MGWMIRRAYNIRLRRSLDTWMASRRPQGREKRGGKFQWNGAKLK